jgi:tetratricopeptide (TPR) repeat protein
MSTEAPPALDITGAVATVQVSDASLVPEFAASANPARAASIRTVERARQDIIAGRADDAIHLLARALSIDPTNPYSYFYLGRAYLIKKNYNQALTFFQRAEIGFTSNPAWLGESRGFEGVAYEETGRLAEAGSAYRRALQAAPNNRIALTGYGRLAASGYTGITDAALRGGPAPPPSDSAIVPAPAMPPPPPPPAEPPPSAD